jgi:coenzyme F420 hydrogenase subunit beta
MRTPLEGGRVMSPEIEIRGCQALIDEVRARRLCAGCGACSGLCPYHVPYRGRMVTLDECNLAQGRCYAFCPRTPADLNLLNQTVFGSAYPAGELGTTKEVLVSRAADDAVRSRAQYGGTVSALVALALRSGLIDTAVLTTSDAGMLPTGRAVRDEAGVLACAGSNFVASPTLRTFNQEAAGDARRIGVVATPCQALALAKMRASPLENRNNIDKLNLVIGLFCTWALKYEDFARFLGERVPLDQVVKVDIPPPPANVFEVYTDSTRMAIPLDQVRAFTRATCGFCIDMTSEFADVSVGAAEGIEGWNTLIVRSDAGAKLVEAARAAGALEVAPLPDANLEHLKEAALLKKRRAVSNIVETTGSRDNLLYLEPSRESLKALLSGT